MKLVEMNWNPGDRQLRQFGATALVVLPVLGWLWGGESATAVNPTVLAVTASIGAVAAVAGWFWPRSLKHVFLGLTLITIPIGMVIGEVAMALIYYGMFVPLGLVFRCIGRDVLQLKYDRQATTYWQPRKQSTDDASYLRQW